MRPRQITYPFALNYDGKIWFLIHRKTITGQQPIQRCKRAFQALVHVAIEELSATADSLLAPVRLGVVRPTAPFALVSSQNEALTVSFTKHKTNTEK